MEQASCSKYILSSEEIEKLKIQLSASPPDEENQFGLLARNVSTAFRLEFGHFIPNSKKRRLSPIDKRIILTNTSNFCQFRETWTNKNFDRPHRKYTETLHGATYLNGYFSLINDHKASWALLKQPIREKINAEYSNELEAQNFVIQLNKVTSIAHEMAHLYQNHHLPWLFLEVSASYYSHIISLKLGFKQSIDELFFGDNHLKMIVEYETLISKFGDSVHRLCFGSTIHSATRSSILRAGICGLTPSF